MSYLQQGGQYHINTGRTSTYTGIETLMFHTGLNIGRTSHTG